MSLIVNDEPIIWFVCIFVCSTKFPPTVYSHWWKNHFRLCWAFCCT